MARKYVKKSDYWENRKKSETPIISQASKQHDFESVPTFDESEHYTAVAACGGGTSAPLTYRNANAQTAIDAGAYKNLRAGIVPYYGSRDGYYSVGDAINLCYRAFFNVPIVRNTICLLQDFSVSPIKLKTTNKTVEKFFTNWFDGINLTDFMSKFFLEYYRSGNVFIYKFNGRVKNDKFNILHTALGAKSDELPVKYIILDPQQVYLQMGPTYNYNFVRMLSNYELARLRDPKTEQDKAVLKSFSKGIQEQIKNYSSLQYVYVPLDLDRLYYVFNRKQDYEPLAIPPIFPVLNDIELKLEMKRMDLSLVRMMEQVVLLVTTGDRADEWNAGLNPKNLQTLQSIFKNQTIGRVLVADYTTKAEWKVPDLKGLLGGEKYVRVDSDIKEGLQYMFFGDEKFANASIKARIFSKSLEQGRRAFLETFLRPEIKKICEKMNFRDMPEVEFEEIDLEDKSALQRIYYQMASLGLLTADELNTAIETGFLPEKENSVINQKEYKKLRDEGLYTPVVPPQASGKEGELGRPNGTGSPKTSNTTTPIGTTKGSYDASLIADNILDMNNLEQDVIKGYCKKYKLDTLNEAQANVANLVTRSIILNEPKNNWKKSIKTYIEKPKNIPQEASIAVEEICAEHNIDIWEAIVLYQSKIEN